MLSLSGRVAAPAVKAEKQLLENCAKLYEIVWHFMKLYERVAIPRYSELCEGNLWDFRQAFTAAATACQSAGRLGSAPEFWDCSKPSTAVNSCQFMSFMLHALGWKESTHIKLNPFESNWMNLNRWSFFIGHFACDPWTFAYSTTASQPLAQKGRNGVYSCHRWSFSSW